MEIRTARFRLLSLLLSLLTLAATSASLHAQNQPSIGAGDFPSGPRDVLADKKPFEPEPRDKWLLDELAKSERGKEACTDLFIAALKARMDIPPATPRLPLAALTMSVFSCVIAVAFMHQAVRFRRWALREEEGADTWSDMRTLAIGWTALAATLALWATLHVRNRPSALASAPGERFGDSITVETAVSAALADAPFLATGLLLGSVIPSVFAIYNFLVGLLVLRNRPEENLRGSFFAALVPFAVATIGFVSSVVTIYVFLRDG